MFISKLLLYFPTIQVAVLSQNVIPVEVCLNSLRLKTVNDCCDTYLGCKSGIGVLGGSHPMSFKSALKVIRCMGIDRNSSVLEFGYVLICFLQLILSVSIYRCGVPRVTHLVASITSNPVVAVDLPQQIRGIVECLKMASNVTEVSCE
jgi:hypothetical protein